jgi:hypothetical protein
MEPFYIITQLVFLFCLLFFIAFLIYSFIEKEKHAIKKIIWVIIFGTLIMVVNYFGMIPETGQILIVAVLFMGSLLIVLPFGNKTIVYKIPEQRYDERDIMLSRSELKEGTEKYEQYYKSKPENGSKDDYLEKNPAC